MTTNYHGINLRDALRESLKLGCSTFIARRTGEAVIEHPSEGRIRVNSRRKDAPRKLTGLLNRIVRHRSEERPSAAEVTNSLKEKAMSQLTTPTIPFEPADECQQGNQQQPPDEPKRPDGVLARLSLFRQEHQEIMALATGRLAKLNEDRRDAMAILQEIEQEIQQIAGMLEAIGAANGPVSVETDSRLAQRVRAPLAQGLTHEQGRAIEFLRTRANVWMTGRRILEEIGCTDKSACHLMNPLIKNGLVEKRGERSGTLYRVIQTVNGD